MSGDEDGLCCVVEGELLLKAWVLCCAKGGGGVMEEGWTIAGGGSLICSGGRARVDRTFELGSLSGDLWGDSESEQMRGESGSG